MMKMKELKSSGSAWARRPVTALRALLRQRSYQGQTLVERFDRRGTEPFELFTSEFGQNSGTSAKKFKKIRNHYVQYFLKYRLEDLFEKSDMKMDRILTEL